MLSTDAWSFDMLLFVWLTLNYWLARGSIFLTHMMWRIIENQPGYQKNSYTKKNIRELVIWLNIIWLFVIHYSLLYIPNGSLNGISFLNIPSRRSARNITIIPLILSKISTFLLRSFAAKWSKFDVKVANQL